METPQDLKNTRYALLGGVALLLWFLVPPFSIAFIDYWLQRYIEIPRWLIIAWLFGPPVLLIAGAWVVQERRKSRKDPLGIR
jgi:hypothetical protein